MSNETSVNRKIASEIVSFSCDAAVASSVASRDLLVAKGAWRVASITAIFGTASSSGTIAVRKITDTSAANAAASSTVKEIISGTTISLAGTANTPVTATLTATDADRILKPGDRLAVNFAGTMTSLAGCLIQIELQPATKYAN